MRIPTDCEGKGYEADKIYGVLATHISNNGSDYIVIVNHNAFYPQDIMATYSPLYAINVVTEHNAGEFWNTPAQRDTTTTDTIITPPSIKPYNILLRLGPGDMMIIEYKKNTVG